MHLEHVATEHLAIHVFQIAAQVALALTERQAQQAHEDGQIIAAARFDRQGLLDEDFQQFLERVLLVGQCLASIQFTLETGTEWPEKTREHPPDQRLLRRSEESSAGKECVSTCSSRGAPGTKKKQTH